MITEYRTDSRMSTKPEAPLWQRGLAARAVASAAEDGADCALLLSALGLEAEEGLNPSLPAPRDSRNWP